MPVQYIFNLDLKTDVDWENLILERSAFHNLGAATEKARSPLLFSFDLGIRSNLWLDDQRDTTGRCSDSKSER